MKVKGSGAKAVDQPYYRADGKNNEKDHDDGHCRKGGKHLAHVVTALQQCRRYARDKPDVAPCREVGARQNDRARDTECDGEIGGRERNDKRGTQ